MSDELSRRLENLEAKDEKLNEAVQQLVITTTQLTTIIANMGDIEPRIRDLEVGAANSRVVIDAIKWLAITAAGSAITILVTTMFT